MIRKLKYIKACAYVVFLSMANQAFCGQSWGTLTFEGGTTSFVAGGSGSANYAACAPNQLPPGVLQLYFMDLAGSSYASQITNQSSACGSAATAVCNHPFQLSAGQCCCLMLNLDGTNLNAGNYTLKAVVGTSKPPNTGASVYSIEANPLPIQVTSMPATTTITVPSTFSIAYTNAGDSSAAGTLTVTNTGSNAANNIQADLSGLTCNTGSVSQTPCTAQAHSTCNITFTATAPTTCLAAGNIAVSGDNTNAVTTAVAFTIAGYYVFALNNSPSSSDPQVIDTSNNAATPEQWGNNVETDANSLTDGFANTATINGTTGIGTSAAVSCYNSTNGGASVGQWYLPAVCQMVIGVGLPHCSNNVNTTIDNLFQLGFLSGLINDGENFWSSTEFAGGSSDVNAWVVYFQPDNTSYHTINLKSTTEVVRCTRALNP